MSSKIARPASMQSLNRPKKHAMDSFVCNRVSSPIKRPSDPTMKVGQRVRVPSLSLTGTVKFFGGTKFKPNEIWVGIELDTKGAGKNDGRIQGVRYFTCLPNTGLFVTPNKVTLIDQPKKQIKSTVIPLKNKVTPKPTKSTAIPHTLKPTKSTATPHTLKSAKPTVTPLRSTKSTAVPKSTKPKSITPKPTKSTNPQPRSTKSTSPQPKSTKSTSPLPKYTKSTSPQPTKIINKHTNTVKPIETTAPTKTTRRSLSCSEKSPPEAPTMVRSQTNPDDMITSLLSAKESYAIQVKEKTSEIDQLRRALQDSQASQTRMARETEQANARASLSISLQAQVDRLEQRIQCLVKEGEELKRVHYLETRDQAAYLDQLGKQLADRDHALATVEKDYAQMRQVNLDTVRSCEARLLEIKKEREIERGQWESRLGGLQGLVERLRQERFVPEVQDDSVNQHQRLETQLDLTTQELDREREKMERMAMEMGQLKEELKRLHVLSNASDIEYQQLKNLLEKEVEEKRQMMEEMGAALEAQNRLEEENESIRLSHGKAQHDLAELLKRLAAMDKKNNQGTGEDTLIANLREENERLLEAQKQSEQECMRLMDELLTLGHTKNKEVPWNRELEHLRAQVSRERKRYEDMEWTLEQKIERLNKELVDLESLVENKVFNETELEERLESERKRVGMLEIRLKETERQIMIPTPTSPVYQLKLNQPT
ncbi:hypothetical protein CU098_010573, partial [Rhizopus stolonifer]